MQIIIREMIERDLDEATFILFEAFRDVTERHAFPLPFPKPEMAGVLIRFCYTRPGWYCLTAEADGQLVGTCIIDERDMIRGIGPVSVDPKHQSHKIGRLLVEAAIKRCSQAKGVRLTQDTFNMASLSLYTRLGFAVKEPVLVFEGLPKGKPSGKYSIKPMSVQDLDECGALCEKIHGINRQNGLNDSMAEKTALVARLDGRLVAYTSAVSRRGHAVAETEEALTELILNVGRTAKRPLGFLLPSRQSALVRWCLKQGLRVVYASNLMSFGFYQEPKGFYFISSDY